MPYVRGFLRVGRRHRPDRPVDPDYGLEGPEGPEISPPIDEDGDPEIGGGPVLPPPSVWPKPPPGIWPPPDKPVTPLPPGFPMPPGSIWPPVRPPHVGGGPARPPGRPPQVGGGPAEPPPGIGGGPAEPPPGVGGGPVGTKFLVAIVTVGRGGGKVIGYTVVDTSISPGLPDQGLPGGGEPEPRR